MSYPNFKNKHTKESLILPQMYISYKKLAKDFPKKCIIIYSRKALDYFVKKYKPRRKESLQNMEVYTHKDICFVRMTGIGAPHATTAFEELIELGGRNFISMGIAGGLNSEGIFLCEKALRDEGVSHHYVSPGKFSFPDRNLTASLGVSLNKCGLQYTLAPTWTIDTPYRETKAEVKHYARQGIATVEMEAAALFAVARYRNVKIAAAFVVSDVLGKKWTPKFHLPHVKNGLHRLIDASVDCLSSV